MLLRCADETMREKIAGYLACVESAGFELASRGSVGDETKQGLSSDLVSLDEYVRFLQMPRQPARP